MPRKGTNKNGNKQMTQEEEMAYLDKLIAENNQSNNTSAVENTTSTESVSKPVSEQVPEQVANPDSERVANVGQAPPSAGQKERGVKMVMGSFEQVLEMGNIIFRDVKDKKEDKKNPKRNTPDLKLKHFQDKYADFGKTFPIVLKHMVTEERFYKDVFRNFVKLCQNKPTHSMDEFQKRQADYLTMIYRKENPRRGQKEYNYVRERYYQQLKKEEEYMKKVMEQVREGRQKKQDKYKEVKKNEILAMIKKYKDEIPDDIEVDLNVEKAPDQMNMEEYVKTQQQNAAQKMMDNAASDTLGSEKPEPLVFTHSAPAEQTNGSGADEIGVFGTNKSKEVTVEDIAEEDLPLEEDDA